MAYAKPEHRDEWRADLLHATRTAQATVLPSVRRKRGGYSAVWDEYCDHFGHDRLLRGVPRVHAIHCLVIFAQRIRRGTYAHNGRPVVSKTVEEAMRGVAQGFTDMDEEDPRRVPGTKDLEPKLARIYARYRKEDPAPTRVWPVTLLVLRSLRGALRNRKDYTVAAVSCIVDLAIIAFWFLCRPGEYCKSTTPDKDDGVAFNLRDVVFHDKDRHPVDPLTCSLNDAEGKITYVTLCFSEQKNAVKGETIGHGKSGDSVFCPVLALLRRVKHLHKYNAPPDTPLYTYYTTARNKHKLTSANMTAALRLAAAKTVRVTGIDPSRIEARSLRSGGATAMLCANIDITTIQLIGRWRSDSMLLYLRTQAMELTQPFAKRMLAHGSYTFPQGAPSDHDLYPLQTPAPIAAAKDLETNWSKICAATFAATEHSLHGLPSMEETAALINAQLLINQL